MAFQFQCPQGHLLQGEEAHMGMQTQCPFCGVMFIIPVINPQAFQPTYPQQQATHYAPQQPAAQPESYLPQELHNMYDPTATQPGLGQYFDQAGAGAVAHVHERPVEHVEYAPAPEPTQFESPPGVEEGEAEESGFLHIPCPNGHELETPYDMLGQEVLCPHCNAQFLLRMEDSREHHEKMEKHFEERGKFWFNWAIAAAVLIGGGLLILLLVAMNR